MADEMVTLKLMRSDVGQIIEGLSVRRDSWRKTQRYLEGEQVDCVIEECSDSGEACGIADDYMRIIGVLREQITPVGDLG